ncbi:MAG: FAD-dependent oxidoreductase [Bacteroidia bacterium]|nr:FAD-dependent oxidoreductase [Bacteroidia bacterium]MDW8157348.1 FAD-dependent oxidoreductase [Bacteroidia bacterium]
MKSSVEFVIVGGGIAGLSTAFFLKNLDREIVILEAAELPGKGASWHAAGMLAPIHEIEFQELPLYHAGQEALKLYHQEIFPHFDNIGASLDGTFEVALTPEDVNYLKRSFEFQKKLGAQVYWYTAEALKNKFPYLGTMVLAGIFAPQDIQIDNRLFVQKLYENLQSKGVNFLLKAKVISWEIENNRKYKIYFENSNNQIYSLYAHHLIFTTGYSELNKKIFNEKIFPVKGQMIAIQSDFPLAYTFRIRSRSLGNGYIVPKIERWILGTTAEHKGNSVELTAGAILDILQKAYAVLPTIYEFPILEMWAGLRPATINHAPIIGKYKNQNIYFINGLYRHGILLGPYLAKALAEFILTQTLPPAVIPFWKEI